MISWVRPGRFYELTGETEDTVKKKRARGHFLEGIHYIKAEDGVLRYHLQRYDEWIEIGTHAQVVKYKHLLKQHAPA